MPYMRTSVTKAAQTSWDAFPEPSPEAETWQPDPDSIPVAGFLPDPRFNKDPLTETQRMTVKRDQRFGLATDSLSTSRISSPAINMSKTSTASGLGSWPAPTPRATGLPRAFVSVSDDSVQASIFTPSEATSPVEAVSATLKMAQTTANRETDTIRSAKGTMETLPAQSSSRRLYTPVATVDSQPSGALSNSSTPAWARSLAHLLEEPLSESSSTHSASPKVEPTKSTSKPPHLRKARTLSGSALNQAGRLADKSDPIVKSPFASGQKTQYEDGSSAEPDKGFRTHKQPIQQRSREEVGLVQNVLVSEARSIRPGHDFLTQKSLLESLIPKNVASSSNDHQRYLKGKLIRVMEDEMDLQKCTTRKDLRSMSDEKLEEHLARVTAAHKLLWEVEQRKH
ncbi:hypothetical protein N0V94_000360 [Neodidymelliopsis sp. IMI 364377]|nr:hypothetical protein N0V94_000360 [Neodidymelliopsis sp. IMI 364377]